MKALSFLFIFNLFLLLLLLQAFSEASSPFTTVDGGKNNVATLGQKHHYLPKINCNYECARRCSKASRKKICLRACKTCCNRCHCVPPGTYGNKHLCPCYAHLKTHGNRPKCP